MLLIHLPHFVGLQCTHCVAYEHVIVDPCFVASVPITLQLDKIDMSCSLYVLQFC